jgi:hypothetical protein
MIDYFNVSLNAAIATLNLITSGTRMIRQSGASRLSTNRQLKICAPPSEKPYRDSRVRVLRGLVPILPKMLGGADEVVCPYLEYRR